MFKKLKKEISKRDAAGKESNEPDQDAIADNNNVAPATTDELASMIVPEDPEEFYADFGCIEHPGTREPVVRLAPYQIEVWKASHKYKRILVIKSNKIGVTTSVLLGDLQLALLPSTNPLSCRGYDILIIAQTTRHANEHIRTAYNLIAGSKKYSRFLITKPKKRSLKSEASKVSEIYLRNPDNENRPTRIIGLGLNKPGSLLSWKNVKHIHISDATAADGDSTDAINSLISRLANTNGNVIIETVPSGPEGKIYELYKQAKLDLMNTRNSNIDHHNHSYNNYGASSKEPDTICDAGADDDVDDANGVPNSAGDSDIQPGQYKLFEIPASEAVKAGIISPQFLEEQKRDLGALYPQYYEAKFVSFGGSIFLDSQIDLCRGTYDTKFQEGSSRVMGVDWGFSGSKTALVGLELRSDGVMYVSRTEQFDRYSVSDVLEQIALIYHGDGYSACYADASSPGIIKDLREGSQKTKRRAVDISPVSFGKELNPMLQVLIKAIKEKRILIHPDFKELIQQLKTAQYDKKGNPDKSAGHTMDLLDALMLAVSHLQTGELYWDDLGPIDWGGGGRAHKTYLDDINVAIGNGRSSASDNDNAGTNSTGSASGGAGERDEQHHQRNRVARDGGMIYAGECEQCGVRVERRLSHEDEGLNNVWTAPFYCPKHRDKDNHSS